MTADDQPRTDLTPEETEAIAVLAKRHRLMVTIVPVGVPVEYVKALTAEVSARLDELVAMREEHHD